MNNDPESKSPAAHQSLTSSLKPQSWSRNPRTSCDLCKQMKIRCQRNDNHQGCVRCVSRGLSCTTTPVERKKRKVNNKRQSYLNAMEDRIKRMESAIVSSKFQETAEPNEEEKQEEKSSADQIESQAQLSNYFSNLVVDSNGSSNFIGWASGFSLLSPQGLQWISEKVNNKDELAQLSRTMSQPDFGEWGRVDAEIWYPRPRSQLSALPPRDLAEQYVNCFLRTFNGDFPVVNEHGFKSNFQLQYSGNPPTSTAWYALFNAVLCLGSIRIKGEQDQSKRDSWLIDYTSVANEAGVVYFRNASSCFHDLLFKEANLMSMQALTLILFITTSSPNPQTAHVVASAAGALANTLGLHRRVDGFGLPIEEVEQRRNVFWVFYTLEKALSQNLGRPSIINDDDIAVDLPPKISGLIKSHTGAKIYDIFQDQVTLAIIGSHRLKTLIKLDVHLQRWRDAVPIQIRPEHPISCSDEQYVSVIMMHFTYLDAVLMLHRLLGHQISVKDAKDPDNKGDVERQAPDPRVRASQQLYLAAARRSVQLLDMFSNNKMQNQHLMWKALYYPLSASLFLFANVLSNPRGEYAALDIGLMDMITSFITRSVQQGSSFAATPTLVVFQELHRIATRLVARIAPQAASQYEPLTSQPSSVATTNVLKTGIAAANVTKQLNSQGESAPIGTTSPNELQESDQSSSDFLDFPPFLTSEPNLFDFDSPTISAVPFDWDMNDMSSLAPELWTSIAVDPMMGWQVEGNGEPNNHDSNDDYDLLYQQQ